MTRAALDKTLADLKNLSVERVGQSRDVTVTLSAELLQAILTAAAIYSSENKFIPDPVDENSAMSSITKQNNEIGEDYQFARDDGIAYLSALAIDAFNGDDKQVKQAETSIALTREVRAWSRPERTKAIDPSKSFTDFIETTGAKPLTVREVRDLQDRLKLGDNGAGFDWSEVARAMATLHNTEAKATKMLAAIHNAKRSLEFTL